MRFIGEGAKKRVYLARDTRLNRDVAVGVIKSDGLDEAALARVRREAQAMGQLGDHPHIVTIFDVVEENSQVYIVSQYMGGGDVESLLARAENHRLPTDEALRIAEQLCQALEHAHARGVIHRDLKPGNVYLAEDGAAELGDFGLAVSLERTRLTQDGMMLGTVAYMPPEQALGKTPDARSDLYALGAMLYEMVAGRTPFLGDDAVAVISQHINTPPVAPSWHNRDVSKPLEDLILALLAKNPERRPESPARVREALRALDAAPRAAAEVTPANPLDRLAAGVFVGRDRELEQLRSGLEDALSGRGRVLMLVGEPGIGKTRTSGELATYASMRGAQVLWGRCHEGEGAPAYWPWVQIIRAYVHDREPQALLSEMGPGAAEIATVVSEVRERLPGLPKPPELEPEEARFRLFDSITTFLKNASGREPLVLIIDDLHWSDGPSLLLLQFLARELSGTRLLVLGTYRDVELGRKHPLEQTLAELARGQLSERVLLRGLTERDVARFIELSSGRTAPEALVEAVYRETEGNPFFVHEVVQLLQSDGRLDQPETVESWSVEIPQGVRQVIGRRLSSLSEELNRVLATAAVIGRDFELQLLARVSDLSEDALVDVIEEAEDARIVAELAEAPGTYRFSHALIRETLYDEIRTTRRLRLHRRIGEAMESLHAGKLEPRLAGLAYHFGEAASGGDVDKAVDYAVRAAERETELLAWEEAATQYDRALHALEAADPVDENRRCELLIAMGSAQIQCGAFWDSRPTLWQAIELARQLGSPDLFARAAFWLTSGPPERIGVVDPERLGVLEEALELLGEDDSALRAEVMAHLSGELFISADADRRDALGQEAIEIARRVGDPDVLAAALSIRQNFAAEDPRPRLEVADEIVALAQESGNKQMEFQGVMRRIQNLTQLGQGEALELEVEGYSRLADELRQTFALSFAAAQHANLALWRGDLTQARRLSWEAWTIGRRINEEAFLATFGLQIFTMRRMQGRIAETAPALRAGAERSPEVPTYRCQLALVLAEGGALSDARHEFEKLTEDGFAALRDRVNHWLHLGLLAEVCALLGDAERAEPLYERLLGYGGLYPVIGAPITGSVSRARGLLAATMGRLDDAVRHFEDAIAADRKMRAHGWLPRTQCDYARVLIDRDGPGDRARALELLGEALDSCQELGLKGWLELCLEQKLRAQGVESGTLTTSIDVVARSIGERRPDLTPHAAPDGTVTLMFSDMEGFTAMTERLGDLRARAVIRAHNRIVRGQIQAHAGYEVELQGDGFLVAFGSARSALHGAIAIQRAFAAHNRDAEEPIRVRIGLHTGEALKDADKFFGKTVIVAARIAAQARGGEILVSSLLKQLAESVGDVRFGTEREVELKGISERQRVCAVAWE